MTDARLSGARAPAQRLHGDGRHSARLSAHARQLAAVAAVPLLLAASSLLYMGGMVLNDFFDQEQDAHERPAPNSLGPREHGAAGRLGSGMLVVGVAIAGLASWISGDEADGDRGAVGPGGVVV